MPLITYHLADSPQLDEVGPELLAASAQLYAQVLAAPVERIRGFIQTYPASAQMVGGKSVSDGANAAPYFEFVVLAGRTDAQVWELMAGFTDLLARLLEVDPKVVRGRCSRVDPADWCIAGEPAATQRAAEIAARAQNQAG